MKDITFQMGFLFFFVFLDIVFTTVTSASCLHLSGFLKLVVQRYARFLINNSLGITLLVILFYVCEIVSFLAFFIYSTNEM